MFEILTSQGSSNDENMVLELSYTEVNSIVHHLSKSPERFLRNIEEQNLWAWDVSGPVKLVSLVATNY